MRKWLGPSGGAMLIDLTRPVVHLLPDVCPRSVILRTCGRTENALEGPIWHLSDNGKRIRPTAQATQRSVVCYETRLPLYSVLPAHNKLQSTELFETTTLRRNVKGELLLWRPQVRICKPKAKWLVAVFGSPANDELVAITSEILSSGDTDEVPLDLLKLAGNQAPVEFPIERDGNRWNRLIDE